jgi:flagellar biosynthesis chaperone FliJ
MGERSLRPLVWLREIRERQARRLLGASNARAALARDELEARRRAHEERAGIPPELTAAQLRALQLQGVRSIELIAEAAAAYASAREEAERARGEWEQAHARLESAKRLEHRRRVEAARRAEAAAQRSLDQLVLALREHRRWR